MTEYYKPGTEWVVGRPAVTTHFGGHERGMVVTVYEPVTAETRLVSEHGQPRTVGDLLAEAGRGKAVAK